MSNELKGVRLALARSVANKNIDDDAIDQAAKLIAKSTHRIRGIDICVYGICIDYFFDDNIWEVLPKIAVMEGARLRNIEVFPWGIINPDFYRVRVTQELDVLKGRMG